MFNYLLYRLGQKIALALPLILGYKFAEFISDVRLLFAPQDRRAVYENLRVIFPKKTKKEILRIQRNLFRNFAKYLVDFFRFEKLDLQYLKEKIRLLNLNYLDKARSCGKGVIVLTAHLGNWELGGVVLAILGYPFWAVTLPHKDKKVDDFFNFQRQSKGVKVIHLGKAVKTILDVIKNRELIALVGDRDFTEKGVISDFFGKPAMFPQGPAALSLKTGAVIVPGFMLRNRDDTFTLSIEKPLEFKASGSREKDLQELIRQYTAIFEDYIRRFPEQWYMFRRFWK